MAKLPRLHTDSSSMIEHSITIKFCMLMTRSTPSGTWVSSAKPLKLTKLISASSRYHPKRALQEGSRFVLPSELAWHQLTPVLDILQKTIIAEEAIVKKAGGKYKMLPLFTETTTKIRAVSQELPVS